MDILTRFELRKIIRRKSFYAGITILILVASFLTGVLVSNARMTGKDGKFLSGIPAIQLEREYNRQHTGLLTVDKLVETIDQHQKLMHDPKNLDEKGEMTIEANAKYDVKDQQIHTLISYAFSPISEYDFYIIDKLNPNDAKEFYKKRIEKVNEFLNFDYSYGNYSMEEKDFFIKMNKNIPVPFRIDYVSGWKNVFENLQNLFLIIAFVISISIAPVFAGEYQSGADSIILSTRYGRSKVIIAKLKASFIVSLGLLLLGVATYTLLLLGIFGFDGGSASVQMLKFIAPVPYSVFQTYLWAVMMGSLACLFVGAVTLWMSSMMKSPFTVIIASGIFLIGPIFIPASKSSRLFNHLMDLMPGNMADGFKKITSYEVFHIFGKLVPEYQVIVVFPILIIVLLLPLSYRAFKKHQVA
ncbi:ABC-type transport system involved in multi-copper enzyme maturation permease subunit [Fontibacillus solani]|uniref:ABC-type transport system involved in multi-copper enzyme maturation permease subunit n=1 Tax=Fontibacillus solani TaxID=1572857 RepID=A0A7W3SY60_9BACL|nr:ABC transporter permease subunit [Fontibacillus solani]MBA9088300.1 ABC-type transport system involved in multi-copper enzyme maturation permease subunit [Fontibacillus solani]